MITTASIEWEAVKPAKKLILINILPAETMRSPHVAC